MRAHAELPVRAERLCSRPAQEWSACPFGIRPPGRAAPRERSEPMSSVSVPHQAGSKR